MPEVLERNTKQKPLSDLTIDQKRRLQTLQRNHALLSPEEKEQLRQLNEVDSSTFHPEQLE